MKVLVKRLAPPMIEWRCPNHPSIDLVMACVRCRRLFEEHTERIARLPKVEKP